MTAILSNSNDYVLVTGEASDHSFLIDSFQRLGVEGKVTENFNEDKTKSDILTLMDDVRLPGTNIILEKGDRIRFFESLTK